jgi:hypothetical protein
MLFQKIKECATIDKGTRRDPRDNEQYPYPCQTTNKLRGEDFINEHDRRIQALTPEDMLDTSEEDARTAENFKMADELHEAELARENGK